MDQSKKSRLSFVLLSVARLGVKLPVGVIKIANAFQII
jgi:hypothetical protein